MIGWHHQLSGREFEQTLGDGERQGSLVCCSPGLHRVGHDLVAEQQNIEERGQLLPGHPESTLVIMGMNINKNSINVFLNVFPEILPCPLRYTCEWQLLWAAGLCGTGLL